MIGLMAMTVAMGMPGMPVPLPIEKRNPTYITGEQLSVMCSKPDVEECVRYVEGASDVYAILHNGMGMGSACIPQSTNSMQTTDAVIAYMKRHPESRARTGGSVVASALNEAFACTR